MRRLRAQSLVPLTPRLSFAPLQQWHPHGSHGKKDAESSQGNDSYKNFKGTVVSTVVGGKSTRNSGKGGGFSQIVLKPKYRASQAQSCFLSTVLISEKKAILYGPLTPHLTTPYMTNLSLRRNRTIITDIPLARGPNRHGNKTLLWITPSRARTPNRLEGLSSHSLRLS